MESDGPSAFRSLYAIRWPFCVSCVVTILSTNWAVFLVQKRQLALDFYAIYPAATAGSYEGLFAYPPATLLLLWPFGRLEPTTAFVVWSCLSATAFVAVSRLLIDGRLALLSIFSPPVARALVQGQTSVIVGAIGLLTAVTGNWVFVGIALGLKPQLFWLAPAYLLFNRKWRALTTLVLAAIAINAVALLIFPVSLGDWFAGMAELKAIVFNSGIGGSVIGIPGMLAAYGWNIIGTAIFGAIIAILILRTARGVADVNFASAIAAPYSIGYDLAPAMPQFLGRVRDWSSALIYLLLSAATLFAPGPMFAALLLIAERHSARAMCSRTSE